jgi:bifunctional non-homologous end joining protein LigD
VTSVYEPRRSREWLKIKAMNEQEFVVVGWTPAKNSDREIGSLHLAVNEGGGLRYAGKVGTGFTAKQRDWWWSELSKDVIPKTDVKDAPRERATTWVKPRHVIQVAFAEWTEDNRLRHPSMLGRREDKGVGEVVREGAAARVAPASEGVPGPGSRVPGRSRGSRQSARSRGTRQPAPGTSSATPQPRDPATVTLTNPDRLLFPRDQITKEELAGYYAAMAEPMLRALRDRPLSLEHWNQGIDKPSWFHQGLGKEAPPWLRTVETPTRTRSGDTVRHLVADSPEALRWLAQMSVLTVHMWASRTPKLEQPDWIVFDLDPAKGKGIEQAIEAAIIVRGLLEHLELPSVVKTSGKRGIHVFVPLAAGYTHEQANAFAVSIGNALAREVPWITMERSLSQRRGRLYLDCMQNAYAKTVVAPYSPRAIDGAPVSAPLEWKEVNKKLDPLKFNIRTMPKRLEKVGDLFAAVFEKRVKLPELE